MYVANISTADSGEVEERETLKFEADVDQVDQVV